LPIIQFICDRNIIHRDIKPQNIIQQSFHSSLPENRRWENLEKSPLPPTPKFFLVDFGAAKVVTGMESLYIGTSIGSPEYVAPEQARGKAVFASDIYSLGVTCLYLLTGISPFDLFDIVNHDWVWRDY
jgi:serine/threonine protein kinase